MNILDQNSLQSKTVAEALPTALLLRLRDIAKLLNVSSATVNRLKASGKLPRHIEISPQCHRWNRSEIVSWIEAGCPAVKVWEARRAHLR